MPSTSAKQSKFMRAVAHSPKFAKKVGESQSVGKDFEMADKKAKKFGVGGNAKTPMPPHGGPGAGRKPSMPREPITGGKNTVPLTPERKQFLKELDQRNKEQRDESAKMAKKATPYAKGGKTMKKADKAGRALVKKSADTLGRAMKMNKGGKCYAGGGLVGGHKSADGIAKKGKTRGKMC